MGARSIVLQRSREEEEVEFSICLKENTCNHKVCSITLSMKNNVLIILQIISIINLLPCWIDLFMGRSFKPNEIKTYYGLIPSVAYRYRVRYIFLFIHIFVVNNNMSDAVWWIRRVLWTEESGVTCFALQHYT